MPLEIITQEFAQRYWQPYQGYGFAQHQALVPLVRQELYRAATYIPIGFELHKEQFRPVALLGQQNDKNLFVAPNGAWAGSDYIPAALRGYPFSLFPQKNNKFLLAIDTDSGLISDNPNDEPFFDPNNPTQPSARIQEILNFLIQIEQHRITTEQSCALLKKYKLLKPWHLEFKRPNASVTLQNIYTTDEEVLATLSPDSLAQLRDSNALAMLYAQMLSSQLLRVLDRLADAHDKSTQTNQGKQDFNLEHFFSENNDTIKF